MIREILSWDNLRAAWLDVLEARAGAGVDGVTVTRWNRNWEERLVALRRDVLANTYGAAPLRRYTVPKRSGGLRHIACLTVTDKVLQRAVLNVLDRHFDPLFLPCSYGYRRGRSVAAAIEAIGNQRDMGYRWVLDADIDECFDSLDHGVIMEQVEREVRDPIVLRLLDEWLLVGRRDSDQPVGIPLGAVISPLLCNVTLHALDTAYAVAGHRLVRYADDFVVLCASQAEAEQAHAVGAEALEYLRLRYEPTKTAITTFERGFDYLGVHFHDDAYTYLWRNVRVTVDGDLPDFLYPYGPDYE